MRLLFLTNFYPPLSRGGYEQWCQETAGGLRRRGHEVIVLTSNYQRELVESDPGSIYRDLHLEMELASLRNGLLFFTNRERRDQENLTHLRHHMETFSPDIVLVWGMWNLPWSLPAMAETMRPGRVVYYIGDYWPTLPNQYEYYWQAPARNWLTFLPKALLRVPARMVLARAKRPTLKFEHALFCTRFLCDEIRRQHVMVQHAEVIHGAIDTTLYANGYAPSPKATKEGPFSMLYAGRLREDKGVHTAIEAVALLVHRYDFKDIRLQIVGSGDSDYTAYLHQLAQEEEVTQFVNFLGARSSEEMPQLYQQSDALLFTSIWQEPFGRVLVEAMVSGVVVVGTASGGAAEIMRENENALTFAPGDAVELASQVVRLRKSGELRQRLSEHGRRMALEKFSLDRMVDGIEAYLKEIV